MFKSLTKILFKSEFIGEYGISCWSSFIILHILVQFSQHNLLNKLPFAIICSCLRRDRLIDHQGMDLFLRSLFLSIDLSVSSFLFFN